VSTTKHSAGERDGFTVEDGSVAAPPAPLFGLALLAGCAGAPAPLPAPREPSAIVATPTVTAPAATPKAEPAPVPECTNQDAADMCQRACNGGQAASCLRLGRLRVGLVSGWDRYDAVEAAAAFTRACDAGLAAACDDLGTLHEGDALPRDYPKAAELHRKACEAGDRFGCANLARLQLASEPGVEVEGDDAITAAVALAEKACNDNAPAACATAARELWTGRRVKKDAILAFSLAEKGCETGDRFGCEIAAEIVAAQEGFGTPRAFYYRQHAAANAQNNCDSHAEDCSALAWYFEDHYGFVFGASGYMASAEKGCNDFRRRPVDCATLGEGYMRGFGRPVDRARAIELYTSACEGGSSEGCWFLGRTHHFGAGVPVDRQKAFAARLKACHFGSATACDITGNYYADGAGVPKNAELHLVMRRRACAWRSGTSCHTLGRWLVAQDGVDVPAGEGRREAVTHLRRGCESVGDNGSCFALGMLHARGWGVPRDGVLAQRLARRACQGGEKPACLWLSNPKKVPDWVAKRDADDAKPSPQETGGRP